jgi:hypothetical protein
MREALTMTLELRAIPPGTDVYTQDGEHLGRVKEQRNDYILIDARLQFDYWLPLGLAASFANGRLTMAFNKNELDKHKADLPGEEERPLDREERIRRDDVASNLSRETGPETQSELYTLDDRELHNR